jgi:hypothetical protein
MKKPEVTKKIILVFCSHLCLNVLQTSDFLFTRDKGAISKKGFGQTKTDSISTLLICSLAKALYNKVPSPGGCKAKPEIDSFHIKKLKISAGHNQAQIKR